MLFTAIHRREHGLSKFPASALKQGLFGYHVTKILLVPRVSFLVCLYRHTPTARSTLTKVGLPE